MNNKAKEREKGFISSMRIVNSIIQEMSERSPLRTAKISDTTKLDKVEFPKDGGILTYLKGYKEPYRGFPYFEMVERVNDVKKIGKKVFGKIYHSVQGIGKVKLIFALPMLKPLLAGFRYAFWFHISKYRMKPFRYSQPVRELYRAWNTCGESDEIIELRDLSCMLFEFDNAYRYRYQDIISELDKKALEKNPLKEILRLIDLLISREIEEEIQELWGQRRKLIYFGLKFSQSNLKLIQKLLMALNLNEIRFTKEDRYFCAMRKDYDFGFCLRGEEKCKLGAPQDR